MGMYANYQEITLEQFNQLQNSEDLVEYIEELQEQDDINLCDIDKMWDALHFLMTGHTIDPEQLEEAPEKTILISEMIIGEESISETDFVATISPNRVKEIYEAIKDINIDDYMHNFDMNKFAKHEIYPSIWDYEDEEDEIKEELIDAFLRLQKFYKEVATNGNAVVVSIY